jgi:hypothetical protein
MIDVISTSSICGKMRVCCFGQPGNYENDMKVGCSLQRDADAMLIIAIRARYGNTRRRVADFHSGCKAF